MCPINLTAIAKTIGPQLRQGSNARDRAGQFAAKNHALLKSHKIFSALIPSGIGGGGAAHRDIADFLRRIAHDNPSTALALAMHQHVIATSIFNDRNDKPGRTLLDRVAGDETVLVSTGSNDWMESNGTATRTDNGYLVSARKPFSSGAPVANLLVTSARFESDEHGAQVIHFSAPLTTEGISFADDWDTLGMRESGSQTIVLDNVFVPDAAVILTRPQHGYSTLFDAVLPCALPLIMSVYLGIAEAAVAIALERAEMAKNDEVTPILVGEMLNHLTTAQIVIDDMLSLANDLNFTPCIETSSAMLMRKTIAANAMIETVEKALETAGGAGYFRNLGLEKLLRDMYAVQFHPLQEKRQHLFSGRVALGLDPIPQPKPKPRMKS